MTLKLVTDNKRSLNMYDMFGTPSQLIPLVFVLKTPGTSALSTLRDFPCEVPKKFRVPAFFCSSVNLRDQSLGGP